MSDTNNKGPLIKKKNNNKSFERPKPVVINSGANNGFKYSQEFEKSNVEPIIAAETSNSRRKTGNIGDKTNEKKAVVGKNNNVKSIKVPHELHTKIGVLGKFMDENKTYAILDELVDYYKKHELTDRQQKQFDYMTEFLNDE